MIQIDKVVIGKDGNVKKIYVQHHIDNIQQPMRIFTKAELNDKNTEPELKEQIKTFVLTVITPGIQQFSR